MNRYFRGSPRFIANVPGTQYSYPNLKIGILGGLISPLTQLMSRFLS
jgi:hypothetical protein